MVDPDTVGRSYFWKMVAVGLSTIALLVGAVIAVVKHLFF